MDCISKGVFLPTGKLSTTTKYLIIAPLIMFYATKKKHDNTEKSQSSFVYKKISNKYPSSFTIFYVLFTFHRYLMQMHHFRKPPFGLYGEEKHTNTDMQDEFR